MAVTNVGNSTGYTSGSPAGSVGRAPASDDPRQQEDKDGFWPLDKCVRAYNTYLDSKQLEIEEQQTARRYRHGAQWTSEQIQTFNDRKQPVVTYNKIGPKVDGVVGVIDRLKQDPKAFPRTPEHQAGADLATAVLRYLCDRNKWNEISPAVTELTAVDGLGGIELDLKAMPPQAATQAGMPPQQKPDYDVLMTPVDNDGFFYDPRSFKNDFSDARFMGVGKYLDEEQLIELMPGMEEDITAASNPSGGGSELSSGSDRDNRWFQSNGDFKQVRLVDIWYKSKGGWKWTLFTGSKILMQGQSPFKDEYGQPICKYLMFSASVDHDGDRYGLPRNLMSPQDEVNQRRSKALHELSNRRIIATKAAIADTNVEAIRREAARADGIVLVNTSLQDVQFDDQAKQAAVMGQLEFMRNAAQEIENFGPSGMIAGSAANGGINPNSSGRAIALMQQAGLAELGPYMLNLRGWKTRVYRALFNAAQLYWTNQRWIRVTDAEGEPQFVQINMPGFGPTGEPLVKNAIGELDVDIILDEGPDTITLMQDTYDAISQALPAVAPMLTPGQATAAMQVLIETSPLPADVKKKFRDAGQQEGNQPDPKQQEAQAKLMLAQEEAKAKLLLQQQESQSKMALEQERSQSDAALKQQAAQTDQQTERDKVQAQMALDREKAQNDMAIEVFKAEQQTRLKQREAEITASLSPPPPPAPEPDMRLDKVLETLAQHNAMLQALGKPRKAVLHRDPRGKLIGGALVLED